MLIDYSERHNKPKREPSASALSRKIGLAQRQIAIGLDTLYRLRVVRAMMLRAAGKGMKITLCRGDDGSGRQRCIITLMEATMGLIRNLAPSCESWSNSCCRSAQRTAMRKIVLATSNSSCVMRSHNLAFLLSCCRVVTLCSRATPWCRRA